VSVHRPSATTRRRAPGALALLGAVLSALIAVTATSAPASAATRATTPAVAATPVAAPRTAPVAALALVGTSTQVTVHRVYRRGQVLWIEHVLDERLLGIDGCQARRSGTSWHAGTYRTTVHTVCPAGPAAAEAAARALVRSRPWYRVAVTRVPLVAFTLLADLPTGNGRAVPAALAHLPEGPAAFVEGDDVSLTYAGPGVTQAQLDAALAAFASALGVPARTVSVIPLAGS